MPEQEDSNTQEKGSVERAVEWMLGDESPKFAGKVALTGAALGLAADLIESGHALAGAVVAGAGTLPAWKLADTIYDTVYNRGTSQPDNNSGNAGQQGSDSVE